MDADAALAWRLQREEEELLARCRNDEAYARSLQLAQQLGLPPVATTQGGSKKTKKNHNHNVRGSNAAANPAARLAGPRPLVLPVAADQPTGNSASRRRRRRKPAPAGKLVPLPRRAEPVKEEDERVEHLMACLRKHRVVVVSHQHNNNGGGGDEEDEYTPVELFEAVRWAFGPDFMLDEAPPPVHVTNCQRLVEAWRVTREITIIDDDDQAVTARRAAAAAAAAVDEFQAWLETWRHAQHSDWERLPLEVMEMIFELLAADDDGDGDGDGDGHRHLLATRLVCRAWHEVTSDANQPFWRRLFLAHSSVGHRLEKDIRRREHLKLIKLAVRQEDDQNAGDDDDHDDDDQDDDEHGCWKKRYYQVLYGVDMSGWDEYKAKGFRTRLINGPRPGKTRPNYGRGATGKRRAPEMRQVRRDRLARYDVRAFAQARDAKHALFA